jgi:predicted acyl esterase
MKTLAKLILVASFAGAAFAQQPNQTPTDSGFKMQFGVRIPMRDKVNLSADIWLPAAPGRFDKRRCGKVAW